MSTGFKLFRIRVCGFFIFLLRKHSASLVKWCPLTLLCAKKNWWWLQRNSSLSQATEPLQIKYNNIYLENPVCAFVLVYRFNWYQTGNRNGIFWSIKSVSYAGWCSSPKFHVICLSYSTYPAPVPAFARQFNCTNDLFTIQNEQHFEQLSVCTAGQHS